MKKICLQKTKLKKQRGQAFIETAIILPLMVILLVGVGYFGSAITVQHNITIAARYAARAVAIESSYQKSDRSTGDFINKVNAAMFKSYAIRSVPNLDASRIEIEPFPMKQFALIKADTPQGSFQKINDFVYLYTNTSTIAADVTNRQGTPVSQLNNMDVGVGALFYGVKITYRLKELDWMAAFLFRKQGVTLQSVAMMPAELPLRSRSALGAKYGLMDLNKGIFDVIRVDVRDPNEAAMHDYVDLIEP